VKEIPGELAVKKSTKTLKLRSSLAPSLELSAKVEHYAVELKYRTIDEVPRKIENISSPENSDALEGDSDERRKYRAE
jgi:hypothetical protein